MVSLRRRSSRRTPGFTLIELLVVVVIIATLAALSIGVAGPILAKGRTARMVSDLRQIGTLVLTYAGENDGRTPTPGATIAYGQIDSATGLPSWQEQLEQIGGKFERKVFAGPEPERLPSGDWVSHFFLGVRAAYAETGAFGPVMLPKIDVPARYLLVGEVRVPGMFSPQDSDRDNYTQDPAFDADGKAKPGNQIFFADGHVAAVESLAGGAVRTTYGE
jgi:prepilin-type N-terminal cleavage/methylation domain-containing protein/prepilin-type processing-associated H-X9-DG protein